MGKRTVLAYILSVAVMVGYYFYFAPKTPPPPPSGSSPTSRPAETAPAGPSQTLPAPASDSGSLKGLPQELPPPKITAVETPLYRAETLNQNAILQSLRLKEYHEGAEKSSPPIDLFAGGPQEKLKVQTRGAKFLPAAGG